MLTYAVYLSSGHCNTCETFIQHLSSGKSWCVWTEGKLGCILLWLRYYLSSEVQSVFMNSLPTAVSITAIKSGPIHLMGYRKYLVIHNNLYKSININQLTFIQHSRAIKAAHEEDAAHYKCSVCFDFLKSFFLLSLFLNWSSKATCKRAYEIMDIFEQG